MEELEYSAEELVEEWLKEEEQLALALWEELLLELVAVDSDVEFI